MTDNPRRIVSISGGKDSTCTYLLAMERHGTDFAAVFADTGNEHEITYEYIADLPEKTGGPAIRTVKADLSDKFPARRRNIAEKWPDQGVPAEVVERAIKACEPTGNPFVDACILRAGFPSPRMRFCTDVLKIAPIEQQVYRPLLEQGLAVENWVGIRRDESYARQGASEREVKRVRGVKPPNNTVEVYRPLLDWTVDDVWKCHYKHGLEPNRLYAAGASRVGCMPCIMARKEEIRIVADRYPEHIDRIEEWERIVALATKRLIPVATFFPARAGKGQKQSDVTTETHGIRHQAKWSRTTRGGKQFDLMQPSPLKADMLTDCRAWGVCE